MNQLNQNNNVNINPFNFQNALMMNPIQLNNQQIMQNNMNTFNNNNNEDNNFKYNISFHDELGRKNNLQCRPSEKISDRIKRYRKQANNYNKNKFVFNLTTIDEFSNKTLEETGIPDCSVIKVFQFGALKGGNFYKCW